MRGTASYMYGVFCGEKYSGVCDIFLCCRVIGVWGMMMCSMVICGGVG